MSYAEAKARYAAIGVDTEAAISRLKTVPISLHCWQGDDVRGFDTDPTKPLTDRDFTRALWQSATECPVVFPEGVGVCPWMVPGGADIAMATSELMKTYQAAIWAQHGLFASGPDFDITFGLAHTIEKSAEIYVKVLSMGGGIIRQTITDDDLRAIARDFGVTLNEKFLN